MNITELKAEIFEAIRFDGGQHLLETANRVIRNPLILLDCGYHPLFPIENFSPEYTDWAQKNHTFLTHEHGLEGVVTDHNGHHWMFERILVQGILIGYAAVCDWSQPFAPEDRTLLGCIAGAAALQSGLYSQMLYVPDLTPHAHRMLFDDLLDMQVPDAAHFSDRLSEISWTAMEGLYVLAVSVRDISMTAQFPLMLSAISQQISQIVPVYTYTYHFNQLVILLCFGDVPEPAMTELQTQQLEQLLRTMDLHAGISKRMGKLEDANEAFAQAEMAIEMPQKLHMENFFYTYDAVALYHMIQISRSKIRDYHTFMHRAIPILLEYDRKYSQELLYTLHVYLRESQRASVAAQRLHIHKNTLHYRLKKICELTSIDLERSDEILHLQISFLILHYDGYRLTGEA